MFKSLNLAPRVLISSHGMGWGRQSVGTEDGGRRGTRTREGTGLGKGTGEGMGTRHRDT